MTKWCAVLGHSIIKCRSLFVMCVGCPLNQGVWRHSYDIQVKCKGALHWTWSNCPDTPLSGDVPSGYGYMIPFDLRSPWWLASNSLYFGAGPSEFLIQWRKVSGCSQVLAKSVSESRWDWPLPATGDDALVFQLSKTLARAIHVRSHRISEVETHHGSTDSRVDS